MSILKLIKKKEQNEFANVPLHEAPPVSLMERVYKLE